jgi:outer membrane protein assembly factor BamB
MHTRSTRLLLAALALLGITSCSKEFSDDTPLPAVQTKSVYISNLNGMVYALNPADGNKKWEFNAGAPVSSTPFLLRDQLFVCSEDGIMHKINALSGNQIRTYNLSPSFSGKLTASPIGEGDFIYVGTPDGNMICFDINADTIRWKQPVSGAVNSSATFSDTNVVFGTDGGQMYAKSKRYGNDAWTFTNPAGGKFTSSPTVRRGQVYIGGEDGSMYAVRANNGTQRWAYKTGGPIQSSPISYGGNIIFGSYDKNVYCIDSGSGLPRWVFPTNDRITSSPYAYNQVIYIGSYDYSLYAIHIITGALKWKVRTDALIKASPVVSNGVVYYGSYDKFLYAADTAVGVTKWKRNIDGALDSSPILADSVNKGLYPSISGGSAD